MSSKNSCRLCSKEYINIKESKFQIFNNSTTNIQERLSGIGVLLEEIGNTSSTICKKCFQGIKWVEKGDEIRASWINATRPKKRRLTEPDMNSEGSNAEEEIARMTEMVKGQCQLELQAIERNSRIIQKISVEDIKSFKEVEFCEEMRVLSPTVMAALEGALGSLDGKLGALTACYGILFKARYSRNRPCIIAHRNDQLLIASGAKKRTLKWLNKMGITNSYTTALSKNKEMAKNHDLPVLEWKREIETSNRDSTLPEYQIIGDNLDFELTTRHQSIANSNKSIHWFHYLAVKDRVHSSQDHRPVEYYKSIEILLGPKTQQRILSVFKILVARMIVTYIPAFSVFSNNVPKHIDHPFATEMSKKSEVVPLGLLFKSENVAAEITDILRHIQETYVPLKEETEDSVKEVLSPILIGGDQLTEERITNVQRAYLDGENCYERLQGLQPKFEDWHLKKTLYQVKDDIFNDSQSGSQFGTTAWAMNVLHCSNAKKGPHQAFNAYKDFNDKELNAQVIAATMTYFQMQSFDADPIPDIIKNSDEKSKHEWLFRHTTEIIKKYIVTYDSTLEETRTKKTNPMLIRLFKCHFEECNHAPFKYAKLRDRHERNVHNYNREQESHNDEVQTNESQDYVLCYQKASLTINLLIHNINDAIREGDGERLIDAYKMAMLYFKCTGHTKYAYSVIKLLFRIQMVPQEAFKIIWGRFVNTKGFKGRNISNDLHLEHMNNFLKDLLKSLHHNLSHSNAERISKALRNTKVIVDNFETSVGIDRSHSSRNSPNMESDVKKLAEEYVKAEVFVEKEGIREYESFPKFNKNICKRKDPSLLLKWAVEKRREFEVLFG